MAEQEYRQGIEDAAPQDCPEEMPLSDTAEYWKKVAKDAIDCSNKFRKEAETYKKALAEVGDSARSDGFDRGKYEERYRAMRERALPQVKDIVGAVLSGKIEINIVIRKNSEGRKNENQRYEYQWGDDDDD